MKNTKEVIRKVWDFIWNDDSVWSWIVNIVLAFVLIKYVLFPFLSLLLGSTFPVVAVVSSSMEHDGNFDSWWSSTAYCGNELCTQEKYYSQFNITKDQFEKFRFKNGFNKGDVMVLVSAKEINIGDTIVYFSFDGRPIIHRVIGLDPLQTKGDNNEAQISTLFLDEKNVSRERVIGKALFGVPWIGYVKIAFVWTMSLFGVNIA